MRAAWTEWIRSRSQRGLKHQQSDSPDIGRSMTQRRRPKTVSCGVRSLDSSWAGAWSRIVPPGLWEIAKPLVPPSKARPQDGETPDTPVETQSSSTPCPG